MPKTVRRAGAWRVRLWRRNDLVLDRVYRAAHPAYALSRAIDEGAIDIDAELCVNVTSVYHACEIALPDELRAAYARALAEDDAPPRGGRRQ